MKSYKKNDREIIVEAELYREGLESGFYDPKKNTYSKKRKNKRQKPFVTASYCGEIKKITVDEGKHYIVKSKGYTFIFKKEWFEENYQELND